MCSRTTCATSARRRSLASSSTRSPPSFPMMPGSDARGTRGAPSRAGAHSSGEDEMEMTWASSLNAYKRIAPNMLLYYRFMERGIDAGLTTFNFGRTSPRSGTHSFKTQWGTRDEQLWWYDRAASAEVKTPSPTDSGYAWGPRIWKRLPTGVATMLGPRIVRYIP